MNLLITGIDGWIASALANRCRELGHTVRGSTRQRDSNGIVGVGEINGDTDWSRAVAETEVVVHLAARVHMMSDYATDPLAAFREVNTIGTLNLATQAATAGVKRFVFLSSIKVNGESTPPDHPYFADDPAIPADPYGISKHEAEQVLRSVTEKTGMEVVIIRPPLVYGPGVKANFESMMRWLDRGLPLPLGAIQQNRRSLIALDNLVDLIITCLTHPAAANQTFLVSDGEDLSTVALLKRMGQALGKPARLFYVPTALLRLGAILFNKRGVYQRLCDSLQMDIGKTRQLLDWQPPITVDEGLRRAAKGFRR
ncbi:MAG: UDP-glucose 4-epimerase family protein [Methylophilaceae bacterium]|jgi:nucleoside-diphosphate-sugar epimerase